MSKQDKKPKVIEGIHQDKQEDSKQDIKQKAEKQAVDSVEKSAKASINSKVEESNMTDKKADLKADNKAEKIENKEAKNGAEKSVQPTEKRKSGGVALALLALLVALGVGGAGHFLANKKFAEVEGQIKALADRPVDSQAAIEMPSFEAEKAEIAKLSSLSNDYQKSLERVAQLEREQATYTQQMNQLQQQIQKLGGAPADQSAWLLSDANFLLTNALRKVVFDHDIDTAVSLLTEADNVLSHVTDQNVQAVRTAIKQDLNQLANVNEVDQDNLMQRLGHLANLVDDMPMVDDAAPKSENEGVSDSIDDWQQNLEKSANTFLNKFIRVSKKDLSQDKGFIAPNQEIYLRENIRLRLQIAILTIPRQQNELYKQSLEAVSTWVRSYFETDNNDVKTFLKEVDELIEKSIYVDAPTKLESLIQLNQILNKTPKPISKIQIEEEKALEELKVEEPKAEESKVEEAKEATTEPKTEPATEQPPQAEPQGEAQPNTQQ